MSNLFGHPVESIEPEPQARARRTDPLSSHLAAAEVEDTGTASDQRAIVLQAVKDGPGRTAGELASRLPIDSVQTTRRLSDLCDAGKIRRGNTRECTIKGRQMLTWWPEI